MQDGFQKHIFLKETKYQTKKPSMGRGGGWCMDISSALPWNSVSKVNKCPGTGN